MSSEHFIKYLKNPKLLEEVTYEELSQLRDKYPYSHILHYLLFLKSQQSPEDLAEHNKNASIFAVDNNKIFEEIKEFHEQEVKEIEKQENYPLPDQKPTEKHAMDDLFDLSDDEDDKNTSANKNEVTPTNDSENADELLIPPTPVSKPTPRVIREQRYIPLDPKIFEVWQEKTPTPKEDEKPVEQPIQPTSDTTPTTTPIEQEENQVTTPIDKSIQSDDDKTDDKINVLFIDALINLDTDSNRIELVTNKDAYEETTDNTIEEPSIEVTSDVPDTSLTQETETPISKQSIEPIIESAPIRQVDIPLEITNEFIDDEALIDFQLGNILSKENLEEKLADYEESSIDIPEDEEMKNEESSTENPMETIVNSETPVVKEEETQNSGVIEPEIDILRKMEDDDLEIKKSFDKWVRKSAKAKKKVKPSKKKKKKKSKMPLNARVSLEETDIIASETLAELLVKQGRNKKAIKVYERLCLIFPQKSNYFAQIIKNLKDKS